MRLRGEKASYGFGVFLKALLALLLFFFLLQSGLINGFIFRHNSSIGWFLPLLGIYVIIIICAILLYHWVLTLRKEVLIYVAVFALALSLRLIIFAFFRQEPVNDFYNYYMFGVNINNHNLHDAAMIIGEYQMPKMGGLALFNAALCYIFTDTVTGQQIAHITLSSLMCPAIMLAFKRLGKKPALLASMLYAVYPSSLVSAQFTTNNHGAALLFLISIYFFIEALNTPRIAQKLAFAALSALFLAGSDFVHSSAIIILIAMLFVTLFLVLREAGSRIKNLCVGALIATLFFSLSSFGVWFLGSINVIYDTRSITPLFKVLMGFNEYHRGFYSGDYDYIKNIPFDQQSELCLKMLGDRLSNLSASEFFALVSEKTNVAWFGHDLYFYFFDLKEADILADPGAAASLSIAELSQAQRRVDFTDGMRILDSLFLHAVYLLSITGVIMRLRKKESELIIMAVLIPVGWMLFIMISEVQSRYRFPAIPFYMVLASVGIFSISGAIKPWIRRVIIRGNRQMQGIDMP